MGPGCCLYDIQDHWNIGTYYLDYYKPECFFDLILIILQSPGISTMWFPYHTHFILCYSGKSNNSDSSALPHVRSEVNGSRKVWGNRTHRGMKSRHLTMIGMYPSYSDTVSSKPSFAQVLVVPSVPEYSWVQELCVDCAHFHMYPVSVLPDFGTHFVSPALRFTLGEFIAICAKVWNHVNLSIFAFSGAETCSASNTITSCSIIIIFIVLESPNRYLLHNVVYMPGNLIIKFICERPSFETVQALESFHGQNLYIQSQISM